MHHSASRTSRRATDRPPSYESLLWRQSRPPVQLPPSPPPSPPNVNREEAVVAEPEDELPPYTVFAEPPSASVSPQPSLGYFEPVPSSPPIPPYPRRRPTNNFHLYPRSQLSVTTNVSASGFASPTRESPTSRPLPPLPTEPEARYMPRRSPSLPLPARPIPVPASHMAHHRVRSDDYRLTALSASASPPARPVSILSAAANRPPRDYSPAPRVRFLLDEPSDLLRRRSAPSDSRGLRRPAPVPVPAPTVTPLPLSPPLGPDVGDLNDDMFVLDHDGQATATYSVSNAHYDYTSTRPRRVPVEPAPPPLPPRPPPSAYQRECTCGDPHCRPPPRTTPTCACGLPSCPGAAIASRASSTAGSNPGSPVIQPTTFLPIGPLHKPSALRHGDRSERHHSSRRNREHLGTSRLTLTVTEAPWSRRARSEASSRPASMTLG